MKEPPLILALDTSSEVTSLAVARGGDLLAGFGARARDKRSERLWTQIEFTLREAGLTVNDVELVAVCTGPGGFTGIRVGIAAAKGLAMAAGRPIAGITSLEATAFAAGPAPAALSMIKSYRGEVYWQLFSFASDARPVAIDAPGVGPVEKALERVMHLDSVVFSGDGAADYLDGASGRAGPLGGRFAARDWSVIRAPQLLACEVARLAYLKYPSGQPEAVDSLRACYVRPSEAEIKKSVELLPAPGRP